MSATPQAANPVGNLVVQYKAGDTNASDNQIKPHFNIKNNGTSAVNLSDLKIRYYFTKDGSQSLNSWIDWAVIGATNIQQVFASTTGTNADTYIELSFSTGAGSIPAGGQTGDIQLRMAKSDWTNFNESNDYSFDSTKTSYTDSSKVTLYQNGNLVWGVEP
ncbi:Endoglucanase 1 precursor [compost metagenome]